eukprot:gene22236-29303_t
MQYLLQLSDSLHSCNAPNQKLDELSLQVDASHYTLRSSGSKRSAQVRRDESGSSDRDEQDEVLDISRDNRVERQKVEGLGRDKGTGDVHLSQGLVHKVEAEGSFDLGHQPPCAWDIGHLPGSGLPMLVPVSKPISLLPAYAGLQAWLLDLIPQVLQGPLRLDHYPNPQAPLKSSAQSLTALSHPSIANLAISTSPPDVDLYPPSATPSATHEAINSTTHLATHSSSLGASHEAAHSATHSATLPSPHEYFKSSGIIGIISCRSIFEKRQLVRSTYLGHAHSSTRVRIVFVIGILDMKPWDLAHMKAEHSVYHDLSLLSRSKDASRYDMQTAYRIMEFYEWALDARDHHGHPYDYIMKADHDTYVHPYRLQPILGIAFALNNGTMPLRTLYHSGGFHIMSRDLVQWDRASGLWMMTALTCLLEERTDVVQEDGEINSKRSENAKPSQRSDAIALRVNGGRTPSQAKGQVPPLSVFNMNRSFGKKQMEVFTRGNANFQMDPDDKAEPPLNAIAVHGMKDEARYTWLHTYFVYR